MRAISTLTTVLLLGSCGLAVAQTLPVVCGLLLAALVLLALASAGLLRGLRRPDKWGGR